MPKVVILSLDYDNCADILFYDLAESQVAERKARDSFLEYLNKITENADIVELYVSSKRQDIAIDELNRNDNKNGSCFKNFANLCKERNWIFRRLLLADIKNNKPAGTAMDDPSLFSGMYGLKKVELMKMQFDDVSKNHPGASVDFHFLDDDNEVCIFREIQDHYSHPEHTIPNNIQHFFLTKCHWYMDAYKEIKLPQEQISIPTKAERLNIDASAQLVLSTEQQEQLRKLTTLFKIELHDKLINSDAMNHSIKAFSLVHSRGIAIGLDSCDKPGCDFFDIHGNWNNDAANIDENVVVQGKEGEQRTPKYAYMRARIDEMLYPDILDQQVKLSDKEKMILCALIHEIKVKLLNNSMRNMNADADLTEEKIQETKLIKHMLCMAAHNAVASLLLNLNDFISSATPQMKRNIPMKTSQTITLGFMQDTSRDQLRVKSNQSEDVRDDCKCVLF